MSLKSCPSLSLNVLQSCISLNAPQIMSLMSHAINIVSMQSSHSAEMKHYGICNMHGRELVYKSKSRFLLCKYSHDRHSVYYFVIATEFERDTRGRLLEPEVVCGQHDWGGEGVDHTDGRLQPETRGLYLQPEANQGRIHGESRAAGIPVWYAGEQMRWGREVKI